MKKYANTTITWRSGPCIEPAYRSTMSAAASVATSVIAPSGADQQRNDDAGQDAAEHQVVDDVRQRVGVVVGVAETAGADRVGEQERAQETGEPGGERAERHPAA